MAPESHGAIRSVEQRQHMWSQSDSTEVGAVLCCAVLCCASLWLERSELGGACDFSAARLPVCGKVTAWLFSPPRLLRR